MKALLIRTKWFITSLVVPLTEVHNKRGSGPIACVECVHVESHMLGTSMYHG